MGQLYVVLFSGRVLEKVSGEGGGRRFIRMGWVPWYVWPTGVLGIWHRGERLGARNPIEQCFSRPKRDKTVQPILPNKTKTTERQIKLSVS